MLQQSNNSNGSGKLTSPQPIQPIQQIVINLYSNGQVGGTIPTDMEITMYMFGEFLKQIGPALTYKEPSSILKPPPGLVIKGGS